MRLDYRGAKECAGAQDDRKAVTVSYYRSLSLNCPTSGADRKRGPLQRQMGKERQHPNPVPPNGTPDKYSTQAGSPERSHQSPAE